jgi:hypothetical protein
MPTKDPRVDLYISKSAEFVMGWMSEGKSRNWKYLKK